MSLILLALAMAMAWHYWRLWRGEKYGVWQLAEIRAARGITVAALQ